MASRLVAVALLALALALPAVADAAGYGKRDGDQRFLPGQALVRYERGTEASERRGLRSAAGVKFESSLGVPRVQVVSFQGQVSAAIDRLEDQAGVAYAQPNYVYDALADTHSVHLWGLGPTPGIGILPAWVRSRGGGQVIAIVDSGVDLTHPDLAGNLWTGPGGTHGHDFVDNDADPSDYNLHGTHVAGTAAALADNNQGVAGVAPQAQIMAVRVLDGDGAGSTSSIANGIAFAASKGAGVINLSLGGPAGAGDAAMGAAISQAEQTGAVVVAAAGNGGNDGVGDDNDSMPTTPCTLPNANLICVAAVTRTGARSDFSNFGPSSVDLGAPGGDGSGSPDADVLSAKPAWASQFAEDFDSGLGAAWTPSHAPPGTLDWGIATGAGLGGSDALADSPSANYQPNTSSQLQKAAGVSLVGQHGCRLDLALKLVQVEEDFDFVGLGVLVPVAIGTDFTGDSGGFVPVELSIAGADGLTGVKPTFLFDSDDFDEGDGAYIDDFNLLCRGSTYPAPGSPGDIAADNAAAGGAYTAIAGTSMAAPHVAGVAALVRAVDPGAPPAQVVQALRNGAKPVAGLAGATVTGGVADAVGAMDAALALPNPQPQQPPQLQPPVKPRVSNVRFNARRGVVSMLVRGDPYVTGSVTLRAKIAARVRVVGRRTFAVGGTRRATVKVKLKRAAMRQLSRRRKLRLASRVAVRNSAGLRSATTGAVRLRLRR
jgi:subtilisin family serine protease